MGPPSLSASPYIGEISCIIFSLRDYIVRVFCLQREKSQGRAPPSKVRHSGGETDKEEEEEEDSVRPSVIRKQAAEIPEQQICLIFPEGRHAKRHRLRARAQSRRQTHSSSGDAAQTRAPSRELCRSESVSRSRAEGEDSLAQVKSRPSEFVSPLLPRKGENCFAQNRASSPSRQCLLARAQPPLRIYIFGDRRVGCAAATCSSACAMQR